MSENLNAIADMVGEGTPDVWSADNIIPFTREHERMLTELHAAITGALAQVEKAMPLLLPLLGGMGIEL